MSLPLALDSNLAILLFVGLSGKSNISKNKRLRAYDERDFELIEAIVDDFAGLILSPNVLTETSNLIRYMPDPARSLAVTIMSEAILRFEEVYIRSVEAIRRKEYSRLGMTDAVLLEIISRGIGLLTDDLDLYIAGSKVSGNVMNFNHIREHRPDYR